MVGDELRVVLVALEHARRPPPAARVQVQQARVEAAAVEVPDSVSVRVRGEVTSRLVPALAKQKHLMSKRCGKFEFIYRVARVRGYTA